MIKQTKIANEIDQFIEKRFSAEFDAHAIYVDAIETARRVYITTLQFMEEDMWEPELQVAETTAEETFNKTCEDAKRKYLSTWSRKELAVVARRESRINKK